VGVVPAHGVHAPVRRPEIKLLLYTKNSYLLLCTRGSKCFSSKKVFKNVSLY
jgi:hypothetical protein